MAMSISNYTGSADLFTFPHNPQTFDDMLSGNYTMKAIPYFSHHILTSSGAVMPKTIILVGHMDGANKLTNYRSLAKHFSENHKLKRLYWETDKFYLGIGRQIKQTNTGGRTNYVDYVATFETVLGILWGNTQKTSGTNAGNVTTYIEGITGTVTSGASDLTATDGTNSWKIPAGALTTGQAIVFKFVEMVGGGRGIFNSKYNYVTIAGTQTRRVETTAGSGILQLGSGTNVSTIVTANLSSAVVTFRDGYIA